MKVDIDRNYSRGPMGKDLLDKFRLADKDDECEKTPPKHSSWNRKSMSKEKTNSSTRQLASVSGLSQSNVIKRNVGLRYQHHLGIQKAKSINSQEKVVNDTSNLKRGTSSKGVFDYSASLEHKGAKMPQVNLGSFDNRNECAETQQFFNKKPGIFAKHTNVKGLLPKKSDTFKKKYGENISKVMTSLWNTHYNESKSFFRTDGFKKENDPYINNVQDSITRAISTAYHVRRGKNIKITQINNVHPMLTTKSDLNQVLTNCNIEKTIGTETAIKICDESNADKEASLPFSEKHTQREKWASNLDMTNPQCEKKEVRENSKNDVKHITLKLNDEKLITFNDVDKSQSSNNRRWNALGGDTSKSGDIKAMYKTITGNKDMINTKNVFSSPPSIPTNFNNVGLKKSKYFDKKKLYVNKSNRGVVARYQTTQHDLENSVKIAVDKMALNGGSAFVEDFGVRTDQKKLKRIYIPKDALIDKKFNNKQSDLTSDKETQMISKRDVNEIMTYINENTKSDFEVQFGQKSLKNFNFTSSKGFDNFQTYKNILKFGLKSNDKQNVVNNSLLTKIPFINKRIVHKIEQAYKDDEEQDGSFKLDKSKDVKNDPILMYKMKYDKAEKDITSDDTKQIDEMKDFEKKVTKDYVYTMKKREGLYKDYPAADQNLVIYNAI